MAHRSDLLRGFAGVRPTCARVLRCCFPPAYQPALPGGGMIVAAAISTSRYSALTLFTPLLRFAACASFAPFCFLLLAAYQPALPPGGGRIPANDTITSTAIRASITHLIGFGFLLDHPTLPTPGRNSSRRAVCNAIKNLPVGVCLTEDYEECEMRGLGGGARAKETTKRDYLDSAW